LFDKNSTAAFYVPTDTIFVVRFIFNVYGFNSPRLAAACCGAVHCPIFTRDDFL
jgi:hypothetical protein